MQIIHFNTQKGIYQFKVNELDTQFHAHPAIELLYSKTNNITIELEDGTIANAPFVVIDRNVKHKVQLKNSSESLIDILMLDTCNANTYGFIDQLGITFEKGIYSGSSSQDYDSTITSVINFQLNNDLLPSNKRCWWRSRC